MEEVLFDLGFEGFEDPTLPDMPSLISQGAEKEAITLRERMDLIKNQSSETHWSSINRSIRGGQKRSRGEDPTPWTSEVKRILDKIKEEA